MRTTPTRPRASTPRARASAWSARPFKFSDGPNDHVTIDKNPDYWNKERIAYIDEVVYKPYADQAAEFNALQAGDIDLAQTIAPNDIATLSSDAKFQVIDRGESCNYGGLQFNQKHAPLDNLNVRKAIAYALNKQAYIDTFYAGLAVPADNWMPPASTYYKALDLPTYDVEKAKAEVAASGLTPEQLTIDFWYPSDVARPYMPDPKGLAESIASDLEAVGFTINFWTAGWRTGYLRDEATGKFPMWLLGWTCDWPGPDNFLVTAFFHCDAGLPNAEFAWGPPELCKAFSRQPPATEADGSLGERPGHLARPTCRPSRLSTRNRLRRPAPPQGLPSEPATSNEPFTRSGSTADRSRRPPHRAATLTAESPGPDGPGDAPIRERLRTARAEVRRPQAPRGDPGPLRTVRRRPSPSSTCRAIPLRHRSGSTPPPSWEQIRQQMGLDKPLYEQYLIYLGQLASGDLGKSVINNRRSSRSSRRRFPATVELTAARLFHRSRDPARRLGARFAQRWPDARDDHLALGISIPIFVLDTRSSSSSALAPALRPHPPDRLAARIETVTSFSSSTLIAGRSGRSATRSSTLILPAIALDDPLAIITRITRARSSTSRTRTMSGPHGRRLAEQRGAPSHHAQRLAAVRPSSGSRSAGCWRAPSSPRPSSPGTASEATS
jgi:hypothetical protein